MADTQSCHEIKVPVTQEKDKTVIKIMERAQWLRAAILGANDGLLSTTSLMLGIGAAKEDQMLMILSGLACALAGACSMTVGEFVSVSTQKDIEKKTKEKQNIELQIYGESTDNNVDRDVKLQIYGESVQNEGNICAKQNSCVVSPLPRSPLMNILTREMKLDLMEESGQHKDDKAALPNPYKAAAASGLSFLLGSLVPILTAIVFSQHNVRVVAIVILTSFALVLFGGIGAHLGGSSAKVSAMRVLIGGWISMAITYGLLKPFDTDDRKHGNNTD